MQLPQVLIEARIVGHRQASTGISVFSGVVTSTCPLPSVTGNPAFPSVIGVRGAAVDGTHKRHHGLGSDAVNLLLPVVVLVVPG